MSSVSESSVSEAGSSGSSDSPKSSTRPRKQRRKTAATGLAALAADEPPTDGGELELDDPSLYIHPEISRLSFNWRVLAQAFDPEIPLLERLRFLTICSTNLDEFFEVRVAGLKEQVKAKLVLPGADGLSPVEVLRTLATEAHQMVDEQYRCLNDVLLPELEAAGIRVWRRSDWTKDQRAWVSTFFDEQVMPVLTPTGLDPAHPFPRVQNKSLNFMVELSGKDAFGRRIGLAVVQAPRCLARLIRIPSELCEYPEEFVMLSSVIHAEVGKLFPGMNVKGCHQFRVTRNSDLWVDEEEVDNLLHALAGELPGRRYGDAVRLEIADTCEDWIATFLLEQFGLGPDDLYRVNGPVNLHRLAELCDRIAATNLKFPAFVPGVPPRVEQAADLFTLLRERDIVLHHPYQSFGPVIELLLQAGRDPGVLAIKQTLYRTGADSPVVDALIEAARAGKEVTAVIELRARFDEAANIDLATRLHEAGAQVVYGVVGYKTHSKMLLIVRREEGQLRRYVHVGTGNYHARTARLYTDIGFMTANPEIGEDIHHVFQQITGLGKYIRLKKLMQSPFTMRETLLELIGAEAEAARRGEPARIEARVNNLSDPAVIRALYEASRAGVSIDLVVRTICCLRPGVPGVSETIRVRSIVGRFLEHSRVFVFHAGGQELTWCASADWMPRNLSRRVEIAWPLERKSVRRRVVHETLSVPLADNTSAWVLQADGAYVRELPGEDTPRPTHQRLIEALASVEGA